MDNKGITETGQVHDLRGNRLVFCFISRYAALSGMKRHRNFCIYFSNIILFKKCVSSKEYLQIYAIMGAKIEIQKFYTPSFLRIDFQRILYEIYVMTNML